jgi:ribonuclease HI
MRNCMENEMWNMSFDGVVNKKGAGAGVWIIPPKVGTKIFSYNLAFDCTNNMVECEALILGLKVLNELGTKMIAVHGDFELVINQVNGIYQSKHPRLRAYMNLVLDLLEEFSKYNLSSIPRGKNQIANAFTPRPRFLKFPSFPIEDMRSNSNTGQQCLIISNIGRCLRTTNRWRDFSK